MTRGTIDRLHAAPDAVTNNDATNKQPISRIPHRLDARTVVAVLQGLLVAVPPGVQATVARGEAPRKAGHRFTVAEVDAALKNANIPVSDRFRLKMALDRNGLLGN